jgi:hypothetical protein
MAFAALLLDPPYDVATIADGYRIDVRSRKTVLLTITWHSGGAIDGGYGDLDLVRLQLAAARAHGANLLVCLHERQRYDIGFITALEGAVAGEPDCEVRFKSDHPDNLSDLLVADVMVGNLSSFLAYFYVLGRPAIHIVPPTAKTVERVTMLFSRFRITRRLSQDKAWMIDPTDTGGIRVEDAESAARAVSIALEDGHDGGLGATEWLARHVPMLDVDGPQRVHQRLVAMCRGAIPFIAPTALPGVAGMMPPARTVRR